MYMETTLNSEQSEIFLKISEIISNFFKKEEKEIKIDSKIEDMVWGSLERVELFFFIERTFRINIPEEKINEFSSIREIVQFVEPTS